MTLWLSVLLLVIGFLLLVKGADFFVDGASNIARVFRVSSLIIGLTVVAFGTSLPEAAVSISSALAGVDDVSFGNIVGSNIFNTALILGVSALVIPQVVHLDLIKRDLPINVLAVLVLIPFFFLFSQTTNLLNRFEGVVLLFMLAGFMYLILKDAKNMRNLDPHQLAEAKEIKAPDMSIKKAIILTLIGMAGIVFGGILVTNSARDIAIELGMSEWLVGLTIVSVGTSLPELVTSVVAAFKKESDIAIGNIVGSNIFNILFILGITAFINPVSLNASAIIDVMILLGITSFVLVVAYFKRHVGRLNGFILLMSYIAYLVYIIIRDTPTL